MDVDGDGVISFQDFNTSLFPLAVLERDYFSVTQRQCLNIANEPICFEGYDSERPQTGDHARKTGGEAPGSAHAVLGGIAAQHPHRPPTSDELRSHPGSRDDSKAQVTSTAKGAARPRTSNFRSEGPKPARTAAYLPRPATSQPRPQTQETRVEIKHLRDGTDLLLLDSERGADASRDHAVPFNKSVQSPSVPRSHSVVARVHGGMNLVGTEPLWEKRTVTRAGEHSRPESHAGQ